MANNEGKFRTNYFRVTDEEVYRDIIGGIPANEDVEVFTIETNGETLFGFGCDGTINSTQIFDDGDDVDEIEVDIPGIWRSLQKILPDGEAIVITEIGSEKLRYLSAYSVIITHNAVEYLDLNKASIELARKMLNDAKWDTQIDY